ncbi:diaminopimelate decarboxylase, partial [Burkholderia sp. SIMBA_013]
AKPVFLNAHSLPNINLIGADCHIGSQIMTAEPFLDAAQRMFNLVSELEKDGIQLTHLDLGGGFGVTYQPEEPLDKSFYLKELVKLAENYPQI